MIKHEFIVSSFLKRIKGEKNDFFIYCCNNGYCGRLN